MQTPRKGLQDHALRTTILDVRGVPACQVLGTSVPWGFCPFLLKHFLAWVTLPEIFFLRVDHFPLTCSFISYNISTEYALCD